LRLLGGGTRVAALPSEMRGFFDCAFDGETVKRSAQNDGFLSGSARTGNGKDVELVAGEGWGSSLILF